MDAGKLGLGGLAALLVGACGGGGHSGPAGATSYAYVAPVLNSSRVYSETIVDNSNNTIDIGFSQTVQAVNADGSAQEREQNTNGNSVTVNGTNYAVPTEIQDYDTQGQETSYVDSSVTPNLSCTFDPHGPGPDWPLTVGQTWSLDYTLTCGTAAAVAYTQTGTVADVESVTVAAGTFNALKLQTTITWTTAGGTVRKQTSTVWRDIATSHAVKQSITIDVSGTLPTVGYAISRQIELQSTS